MYHAVPDAGNAGAPLLLTFRRTHHSRRSVQR